VEHLITATDTFIRPLSRAEKEQVFAESITWFERYGVSSRGTPGTYAEFEAYFEHALAKRLVAHRTASYGVGYATKGWPRPTQIPAPVWWLLRRPVNAVSSSLTIGVSAATDGSPGSAGPSTAATEGSPAATGCTRSRCARSRARAAAPEGHRKSTCRKGAWPIAHPWDCWTPTR
jgi:hypothetical protein